jgi:drug/metabolite transporter (DMT)-like permease
VLEGDASVVAGPREARTGLIRANIAVVFFGLAGALGKLAMLPAPLIVLGRVVFAGATLLLVTRLRRVPLRARSTRDLAVLLLQGALLALHWTAFFQSINVSNVAIGLLSFSSFPVFTAAIEPVVLRQRPNALQVVAALLVIPGIYLLVPAFTLGNSATVGVLWGLLAGATFALLSVVNRWLGRSYPSMMISLYQDGTAAIILLPTLAFLGPAALLSPRELVILAVLGVVCTALAHTLFIEGMRGITAQLASVLASLEPVWGIGFALILLHEIPSPRTLIGGAIILAATLVPAAQALRPRLALRPLASSRTR